MGSLSAEQIDLLAVIVVEECGSDLSDDQIAEQVAMLLEDVPGFDVPTDDDLSNTIQQVRSAYHVVANH